VVEGSNTSAKQKSSLIDMALTFNSILAEEIDETFSSAIGK